MSEFLKREDKQERLKAIIRQLHAGAGVQAVKKDFQVLIRDVSPEELAQVEHALLEEGVPPEEIQRLCEVHVDLFHTSLVRQKRLSQLPGHPVHTLLQENEELRKRIKTVKKLFIPLKRKASPEAVTKLAEAFEELRLVDRHYLRIENQLFPFLEKKNFSGPSKVMWGKHNEIRAQCKSVAQAIAVGEYRNAEKNFTRLSASLRKIAFMEEKILLPTCLQKLEEAEWALIRQGEGEIGYAWVTPGDSWDPELFLPQVGSPAGVVPGGGEAGGINLEVGCLNREQVNLMLKALPVEITYVDENDKVVYYSGSAHRLFPRTPAIIGRTVQNCHPTKSVQVVNRILTAFKEKRKREAEFWLTQGEAFIYIRYVALYNETEEYKGCIEITQDIADLRHLEGERRLLEWS